MTKKKIEDVLTAMTPAEMAALPEDQRAKVSGLRKAWRRSLFRLVGWQIALIAGMAVVFEFAHSYQEQFLALTSRFLSDFWLSLLGAFGILISGIGLYQVREHQRLLYGMLELSFAVVYGFFSLQKVGGAKGYSESVGIVAAVYLVVRGADNFVIGWRARQEKLAERRAQLESYLDMSQ